jgi:hypothetical protein
MADLAPPDVAGRCAARPIFVIGAPRSGASLLTWALGQHPNIRPVQNMGWLDSFAAGLYRSFALAIQPRATSQLDAMEIELDAFCAHFGEAANRLVLASEDRAAVGGPQRWVDGTPGSCFSAFALTRLFPEARFIHVLRDAGEVVASLTNPDGKRLYRSHHVEVSEDEAYEQWLAAVRAGVEAERAFGGEKVLRVRRDDLFATPETTLRRCLAFVREPYHAACLRPFR